MSDGERAPPEVKTETQGTINIKVAGSTGEEIHFKIKRSTKLTKLRNAYANKVGKDMRTIRFLYEGNKITDDDTLATLDMEEEDSIDAVVEQIGGSEV